MDETIEDMDKEFEMKTIKMSSKLTKQDFQLKKYKISGQNKPN